MDWKPEKPNDDSHYADKKLEDVFGDIDKQKAPKPKRHVGRKMVLLAAVIVLLLLGKNYLEQRKADLPADTTGKSAQQTEDRQGNVDDTLGTLDEEKSDSNTVDVPGIAEMALAIEAITPNIVSAEAATILQYNGTLTSTWQEDTYTFHALLQGRYCVELCDLQGGAGVKLSILNANGDVLASDSYCVNGEAVAADLTMGYTYQIRVVQCGDYGPYGLKLCYPKSVMDISNVTQLTDTLECVGQANTYFFMPSRDGRYRFELSNLMNGTVTELYVCNSLNETVAYDTYCTNEEGVTVKDMKAGEAYKIQVCQCTGLSDYTLTVGQQKETVDISALTELTDSLEYTDQRNVYSFTVPRDGRYRFELSGMMNGTATELYVFNNLNETVAYDTYCKNGGGVTVQDWKAGEVYEVQIRQSSGLSSYHLTIGQQKPTVALPPPTTVNDSIEYTDQRNVYSFTSEASGDVELTLSNMESGMAVELYVFNELEEKIAYSSYCKNEEQITAENLNAGEQYEIQVRQTEGLGSYTLTVGTEKE